VGELPLVFVATGKIQIVGSLSAAASGSTAVAGGLPRVCPSPNPRVNGIAR